MSDQDERRDFLVATPFFGGLQGVALDFVIGLLKDRSYFPKAAVFEQGEQGRAMYIVRSGELLKSQTCDSGREVKMVRFHPGDFFGETTLIEMQPRAFSVFTETECHLYELTNMDLYRLYKQDVHAYVMVLQNINRELCRRVRKADDRITEYADEFNRTGTQMGLDVNKLRARLAKDEK